MNAGPSILIRTPNWLGDTILTTPAITGVVNANPDSTISILAPSALGELFAHDGRFEEVITFRREEVSGSLRGAISLAKEIRKIGFDKFLIFPNSFSSALTAFLSGTRDRIGYSAECRRPLLTKALRFRKDRKKTHRVLLYADIAALVGCTPDDGLPLRLDLPQEESDPLLELSGYSPRSDAPLVAIAPSSFASSRRWPVERFALLADRLAQSFGAKIVLLGSVSDAHIAFGMSGIMKTPPISLVGKTSLLSLSAVLRRMNLLIANDSGVVHLACALGIPYLVLFGAGDPSVTGPWHGRGKLISKELDCSPCVKQTCSKDLECMKAISVDEVFAEVSVLIEHDRGRI
ncbi:MAG: lipopolysaccharide heptosyltransferase II [Candidatus Eisenbacteria bacterium]|nr:lipopolysaccharide heptosyltransferase II [Candidatus Eisenbacteria bacterium]